MLRRIQESFAQPLSPLAVLTHVREGDTSEAGIVEGYVAAATLAFEEVCQRTVCATLWELQLPCFPGIYANDDAGGYYAGNLDYRYGDRHIGPLPFSGRGYQFATNYREGIELRVPPVLKIDSVQYYDGEDTLQTMPAADYQLFQNEPALLVPTNNWPTTKNRRDAVTIRFWAGELIPLTVDSTANTFTTEGYQFANDDRVRLSISGNTNSFLGNTASLPVGLSGSAEYFVVGASGALFQLATTSGGTAIDLSDPVAPNEVQSVYAGALNAITRQALLLSASNWYTDRCQDCSCSGGNMSAIPGALHHLFNMRKWDIVYSAG